jgi:hypothetical protein
MDRKIWNYNVLTLLLKLTVGILAVCDHLILHTDCVKISLPFWTVNYILSNTWYVTYIPSYTLKLPTCISLITNHRYSLDGLEVQIYI